jgi:hypothetical protein
LLELEELTEELLEVLLEELELLTLELTLELTELIELVELELDMTGLLLTLELDSAVPLASPPQPANTSVAVKANIPHNGFLRNIELILNSRLTEQHVLRQQDG